MTTRLNTYDVIVIGAGPAGSIAAYQLARAGKTVLLLERSEFPRSKVCGCCIASSGTGVLEAIGLADAIHDACLIRKATFMCGNTSATIPTPAYRVLSRETLDSRLVEAARAAGAEVLFSSSARVTQDRLVQLSDLNSSLRAPLHARFIIVADGLGGTSLSGHPAFKWQISASSRMGVGATLDPSPRLVVDEKIVMLCHRVGYLGLVKLPSGQINAAAALDPNAVREFGGPMQICSHILSSCGLKLDISPAVRWHGTGFLTRTRPLIEFENIFVLGDAAGYVEPFTGEGMSWAFESAVALSRLLITALDSGIVRNAWTNDYRTLLATHHTRCQMVSQFMRYPMFVKLGIRAINCVPSTFAQTSRILGTSKPSHLLTQGHSA